MIEAHTIVSWRSSDIYKNDRNDQLRDSKRYNSRKKRTIYELSIFLKDDPKSVSDKK